MAGKKKQSWLKSSNHPPFLVLHFLVSGRVSSSFTGQISGSLTLFPVVGVQRDGNFLHFQASFIHLYLQRRQGGRTLQKKNWAFNEKKKIERVSDKISPLKSCFFLGGGNPCIRKFHGIYDPWNFAEKNDRPTFTSQRLLQFDTGIACSGCLGFWLGKKSPTKN